MSSQFSILNSQFSPVVGLGEVLWDLLPAGRQPGGAPFNFAFHCHQLGHPAVIVSRVGEHNLGRDLRAEVRRLGMSDEFIQTDPDHPTGTVRVEVGEGGQPRYTITPEVAYDYLAWDERLEVLARSAPAVCFGTLAQRGPVSRATIRRFIETAREGGNAPLVVFDINLRQDFYDSETIEESLRWSDWLKLNEDERGRLAEMFGLEGRDEAADLNHLHPLHGAGRKLTCLTRGDRGCTVFARGCRFDEPGVSVAVADTVGAGDAFTAALLTQVLEGRPLPQALRFANRFAARVAARPGGTPRIDRAELEREFASEPLSPGNACP